MRAVGYRNARGFTLIEVMVSIVVLAFGLLGFALLQTWTVRFTQSAAYKTQATNLGYSLLDDMRANRLSAAQYAGAATFAQGSVAAGACVAPTGTVSVASVAASWRCDVVKALGEQAGATVTYVNGIATVSITWGERVGAGENPNTTFVATSRL